MSTASDEELEARALVDRIRAQHSFAGNNELAVQIQALLHMTASEFYDVATHFLLELLQNADDNEYPPSATPSLTFTYEPGGLQVDCNEIGFQAKHVKSISQVRSSTKIRQGNSQSFTGEKGIGFKSVFRVADEVWISSRQYRFKFDKAELFGMIAPKWADFPRSTCPDQTSFYLKLSKDCKEDELIKHLQEFDPRLLLFLKKIRNVTVRILKALEMPWGETILKSDTGNDDTQIATSERPLTIIETSRGQLRYLTLDYVIENLPEEPRRPLCSFTNIVLAFPVTDFPNQPQPECHKVYATLPISDHGFKFPLQGDFILTANRLHIDFSLAWNQAIRDGLANAFIQAVNSFIKGPLKYYWPHFIPPQDVSPFFQPSRSAILTGLRDAEVIESFAGALRRPSQLFYVKDELKDSHGRPFTFNGEPDTKYLSGGFSASTAGPLLDLGVNELTDEMFLSDLESIISLNATCFHENTVEWHAQLADALVPMVDDPEKKRIISRLLIIPLQGGGWTTADQQPAIISKKLSPTEFPVHQAIKIVAPAAIQDERRRKLYDRLGILELDTPRMCGLIADTHASPSFEPENLSKEELISHARFLFDASWQPPDGVEVDLWFATSDGGRCKGSLLYLPTKFPKDSSTAQVFEILKKRFAVIHEDYTFVETSARDSTANSREDDSFAPRHFTYKTQPYSKNPFISRPYQSLWLFNESDDIILEKGSSPSPCRSNRVPSINAQFCMNDSTIEVTKTYPNDLPKIDLAFIDSLAMYSEFNLSQKVWRKSRKSNLSRTAWRKYLIKTLHLSEVPRLTSFGSGDTPQLDFRLSDEFRFLLTECPISHVVELLHTQWNVYSRWIELDPSMKMEETAIAANKLLLEEISNSIVQTSYGRTPLSQTVFPLLDSRIDELGIPIPCLSIIDPKDATLRRRMACFGIKVENDIGYYLQCLTSMNRHLDFPDHEALSYVYEQIQARYDENEEIVDDIFHESPLIYDPLSRTWVDVKGCVASKILPSKLYPKCEDLFLGILDDAILGIESLIKKAACIDCSWELSDIFYLLSNINHELKGTSTSNARKLLKPIRGCKIFPVIAKRRNKAGFDNVLSRTDDWFIADRPHLAMSFECKIPILAFEVKETVSLEHLFKIWGLDVRKLSVCTTGESLPSGNFKISKSDTCFLQDRSAFISALVPTSHPNQESVRRQLSFVTVIRATNISQTFKLRTQNKSECVGNPIPSGFALWSNKERSVLRIFTTNNLAISHAAPFELVELLANYCEIHGSTSRGLLSAALNDPDTDRVRKSFEIEGFNIVLSKPPTRIPKEPAWSGDMFYVPSPFTNEERENKTLLRNYRGIRYNGEAITSYKTYSGDTDRRIPLMHIINADMDISQDAIYPEGAFFQGVELDPNRHLEYLGQYMTARHLEALLGEYYDPLRHWTSDLRDRAGLPAFSGENSSPFTIRDSSASWALTNFLVGLGHKDIVPNHGTNLTYFIEVAVSSGNDGDASFLWTSQKLTRIKQVYFSDAYQLDAFSDMTRNVVILVRIRNVYTVPQLSWIIDPWEMFESGQFFINDDVKFRATIDESELGLTQFRLPSFWSSPAGQSVANYTGSRKDRPFNYKPLNDGDFRLLVLFPGMEDDPLQGAVLTCQPFHKEDHSYRTLSYEWGPEPQAELPLLTHSGVIQVRKPLYTALKHIRQKDTPVILWVDSICINQKNESEKAKQIRLLPLIFRNAICTLAFISTDRQYDEAIKTLLQIKAKAIYGTNSTQWPPSLLPLPASWLQDPTPQPNDPIWSSVKLFFEQTWFVRVWIIQEAVVAPTVSILCGSWKADWVDIHAAIEVVQKEIQPPKEISKSWKPFMMLSYLRGWEAQTTRWDLLTLLDTFAYAQSTLKRDRFFALLGLASDGDRKEFAPDYRRTTPFEDIACRFGRAFAAQGKGLSLLYRAGLGSQPNSLPSWLPDLTTPMTSGLLGCRDQGAVYNASANLSPPTMHCLPANNVLTIPSCYLVDEIVQISKSSNGKTTKALAQYFKEVDSMIESVKDSYGSDDGKDLRWQVPVAGAKYPKSGTSGDIDIVQAYEAFRQQLRKDGFKKKRSERTLASEQVGDSSDSDLAPGSSGADLNRRQKSQGYVSLLGGNLAGWRFVTTKHKLCGVVPGNAQVGDLVCIIPGGKIPFLIRNHERQQPLPCRLIKGCYIHGMMLGESLEFQHKVETTILLH